MTESFHSTAAALMALSAPDRPNRGDAFHRLSSHPDAAALTQEVFRDTLKRMGDELSETGPSSGEPSYTLAEVAGALTACGAELDLAVRQAKAENNEKKPG